MDLTKSTINGKSLDTICQELKADIPRESIEDRDGNFYIPVEVFKQRLDSVLGMWHYSIRTGNVQIVEINGSYQVLLSSSLTIYDDNGNEIITKEASGASQVIIVKDTQRPKSFKSDIAAAESDGLKQICKKIGIGERQLIELNKKKKSPNTAKNLGENKTIKVSIVGDFRKNDKMLKAACLTPDGDNAELVIFQNKYKYIEEKLSIDEFCRLYANKSITIEGMLREYNGLLQIIFNRPAA